MSLVDSTNGAFGDPELPDRAESDLPPPIRPVEKDACASVLPHGCPTEQKFAALAEQCVDAMFFLESKSCRITEANSSFFRMLGYERADLPRLTLYDIVAETTESVDNRIKRVCTGQEITLRERVYRHRDGSLLNVEVFATPVLCEGTKLIGIIARDITARREAERVQMELREVVLNAAAEWRDTFDSIADPMFVLDSKGFIQRMNVAGKSYLHSDFGHLLSHRLPQAPEEPWITVHRLFGSAISGSHTRHGNAADSHGRYFGLSITPTHEGRFILMMHDLTDQRDLQDSLKRSEAMSTLGALVGGVAHEVRNPLFALSALLQAFEARFGWSEDQATYVQQINAQLDRLNHLMNELLQYGKAASFHREVTPVSQLLTAAASLLSQSAASHQVRIELLCTEDLNVNADPQQMTNALRNVMENAILHSPAGELVSAEARRVGRKLRVEVRDHGTGLPANHTMDVFKPFFSKRPGGTGLGLSIVERIVREHNGTVSADNHPEGGAVVTITLPAFVE